jgi:outer membrane immunogenic protein
MRSQFSKSVIAFALMCLGGTAFADGYDAPRAVTVAAPIWTGFYGNAGVGYGFWSASTTTDAPGRCVSCATTDHSGKGWLGEVGLGYDYQITDKVVIGALFNYNFTDMQGRTSDAVFTTAETSADSTWFLGLRAGLLLTPDILSYVSAGYTQTHFSGGALRNSYTGNALPNGHLQSYNGNGWFIAGGMEVALHNGWFWRNEVRYADYSEDVRIESGISPAFQLNFDPTVATATTGVVYKFDWHH